MKSHFIKTLPVQNYEKDEDSAIAGPYALIFPLPAGYFDLQISNVQIEDDGEYQCQVTAGGRAVISRKASIYVLGKIPLFPRAPNPPHSSSLCASRQSEWGGVGGPAHSFGAPRSVLEEVS